MTGLQDELAELRAALAQSDPAAGKVAVEAAVSKMKRAWQGAAFSSAPDDSLKRYFTYHLKAISSLLNGGNCKADELLRLTDHLLQYYGRFCRQATPAPERYHRQAVSNMDGALAVLRQNIPQEMHKVLTCWLDDMVEYRVAVNHTFASLHYFQRVVTEASLLVTRGNMSVDALAGLLLRMNFNYLPFFAWYQSKISSALPESEDILARLDALRVQRIAILSSPVEMKVKYDARWPDLNTMMRTWLEEEISAAELALRCRPDVRPVALAEKLFLQLPVSYLACLLRLFYEEGIFSGVNLSHIFRFMAGHYRTKRQATISAHSLSKEYYSIDQHTAARVKDLLQKMLNRLNQHYFPVWVAISALVCSSQGI